MLQLVLRQLGFHGEGRSARTVFGTRRVTLALWIRVPTCQLRCVTLALWIRVPTCQLGVSRDGIYI